MNKRHCFPVNELNSVILECKERVTHEEHRLCELAKLIKVCTIDKLRCRLSSLSVVKWLEPAIFHNQYLLLKGPYDRENTAYFIWAWVDDDTYQRYMTEDRFHLHNSNWNEGSNLIIVDACIPYDFRFHFRKFIEVRRELAEKGVKKLSYCQRDSSGKVSGTKIWNMN